MPDEQATPAAKGPAPVQGPPPVLATLALEYQDGQPVIVVADGNAIPTGLKVVDASGNAVAAYGARSMDGIPDNFMSGMYTYAYDFYR
ncbi:hypothetical protein ACWGR4_38930 [Embleya sp. NPDC055664]